MRLLILSSRFPLPLEKGDKLRLYHQIRYLAESHEIILVSLAEMPFDDELVDRLRPYCKEIYVMPFSRWDAIRNTALGMLRNLPINVGYFYSKSIRTRIQGIIERTQPDAIYVQLIRMAQYVVDQTLIPKAIDYMDSFSLRAQRRAEVSSQPFRLLWRWEAKVLRRFERKMGNHFELKFAIAGLDLDLLAKSGVPDLKLLPNGIDTQYFNPSLVCKERNYDVVFVGNMSYHPNVVAVQYLIDQIATPLRKKLPNLKVLIAGARPVKKVKELANDWVTVSGHMSDIREAYASARVFVAPIFMGSGMQNKILEAIAMKIPCITTPQVNDGIGLPDDFIKTASSPEQFKELVVQLLSTRNSELLELARAHVIEHFDWKKACTSLEELDQLK